MAYSEVDDNGVPRVLQWGRRLSPADGEALGRGDGGSGLASMGPPALTGGWLSAGSWPRPAAPCFNGAAAGSHRRMARRRARQPLRAPRFNGAAGSHRRMEPHGHGVSHALVEALQWGRRLSPADGRKNSPADGATRTRSLARTCRGASMGLPALTGGWSQEPVRHRACPNRFNGAAGSHRWMVPTARHQRDRHFGGFNGAAGSHRRMALRSVESLRPLMLQWGRRLSPADGEKLPREVACEGIKASMGPPALTGGWPPASFAPAPSCSLQWGRRLSPADGRACPSAGGRAVQGFNGAAGSHRRMETRLIREIIMQEKLQWGRRLSPADGYLLGRPARVARQASMGPPALTGGWTARRAARRPR